MNKPVGYICSYVSDSHKTVYELLTRELRSLMTNRRGRRLHTIGRLDCETSGLLLFTTDGYFSNYLTRSKNHIEKTYEVVLKNAVSPEAQNDYAASFKNGVILPPDRKFPEQPADPAEIEFLSENRCRVKITEGKFHQVRRMFLAVGNEVAELKRICIGNFTLPENLKEGEYVDFCPEQI